jgi:ribosomal protein S12 methylthiotransferase
VPVLIEGPSADSELVWQARLSTQAPEIDGVCYITDPGESPLECGQMRRMRITGSHDYDLTGDLIDVLPSAVPSIFQIQPALIAR